MVFFTSADRDPGQVPPGRPYGLRLMRSWRRGALLGAQEREGVSLRVLQLLPRGMAVFGDRSRLPMKVVDKAVLDTLLAEILTPEPMEEITRHAIDLAHEDRHTAEARGGSPAKEECRTGQGRGARCFKRW